MTVFHIRMGNLAKIHPQGNWWTKEGFDVRAAIVLSLEQIALV